MSRIYSDEQEGVVWADSEYVNDVDEPIRGRRQNTHPIYVDTALISIMNAETRRSSRLADKPALNYKETRDRKAKTVWDESPTAVQEFPDKVESSDESDDTVIEDELRDIPNLDKQLEDAQKLFRTIANQDEPFPNCLKGCYEEDPTFKPILDNPESFTNFEIKEGLIFFRSEGIVRLAIPNVMINGESVREKIIRQGHSILAHLGGHKTLTYLRDQVWWKTIVQDVTDYCKSCSTCATSKSPTEKPRGLLKTMPVPTHPWQYIGIDLVGPLPESLNRNGSYDMICVIIDLLMAMVHLVPTRQTYKAADMAEVIFDTVFKLHGLPERIISDRDSLFTSHFWRKLHALLNVDLRLSSAFHPQTDGATERANRTMTQMLRQCVSPKQKDWAKKLPAIEFAMNSARSSTTGFTPFYLNYGRNPSPMIWKGEEVYPGVRQFTENIKDAIMCAHDVIITSRVQHTVQANRKWLPATYQGDLVYLSTKNISMPKGRARKLAPKYLGPFPITKVLKEGATYQLGLSDELIKRGVNRAFHASLLRPHVPNDDRRFPGRMPCQIPGFGEKPEEWIVDSILSHHGKGLESEFQVLWKAGDKTWAPYREVAHLNALDRYCELMGVKNVFELSSNYVYEDSEEEDDDNIIQSRMCEVREMDKRENETTRDCSTRSDSSLYPTYSTMLRSTLSTDELRECLAYEHRLNTYRLGVAPSPDGPLPGRWVDFLNEQDAIMASRRPPPHFDQRFHQGTLNFQQPPIDNVSMPADTLETIIRAIGQVARSPPAPVPRIPPVNRYVPKRPPPPPVNNRGGRGGFGGRGRGKAPANRRGKRGGRTEDPRRNRNVGDNQIPIPIPGPTTVIPGPINVNNEVSIEEDDLAFLNEFANEIPTGSNDVLMNNEIAAEGEFTV